MIPLETLSSELAVRFLLREDIGKLVKAFHAVGWLKSTDLFETYLKEQESLERLIWLACFEDQMAGYITLKWESLYPSFKEQNIPEIMDLNVLPYARNRGVGSTLLDTAEKEAATRCNTIGLGVGLYAGHDGGYGSAQRLYIKRGYIPDGKGVTYGYNSTTPGMSYPLDDDLILWLTKVL
jgi:ribosomal protein S18 acetylase RimI-like enzyme